MTKKQKKEVDKAYAKCLNGYLDLADQFPFLKQLCLDACINLSMALDNIKPAPASLRKKRLQ